jgi:serine/threonine protein kinase
MERQFYTMREMEPQLKNEIEAMKRISSSGRTNHVAKLFDCAEESGLIFLRMELCTFNLEMHAIQQPCRRIPERDVVPWAQQLCFGLQDIHSLGIIHRDIKPTNLVVGCDGKLKIIDFGWSAFIADLRRSKSELAGTFQFMAPEILEDRPQTESVDLWSSGATLLELLTGQPLITTINHPTGQSTICPRQAANIRTTRALNEIRKKCPLPQHGRPNFLSPQCWAFCQALLMPQVSARISLQAAMSHAWVQRGMQGSRSWTPPIAGKLAPHVVTHDHHSWDGSTTASSSGSTPRFPNIIVAPAPQIVDRGRACTPFVSQAYAQNRFIPLLSGIPKGFHRV